MTRLALARAQEKAGHVIDGEDVFVIGDTVADVQAAREIEAAAVAVCTGYTEREQLRECRPDYLLEDLSGFLDGVMV